MHPRYRPGELRIPREILFHRSLSPSAKLIWTVLQLTQDRKGLIELTGLSKDGVTDGLDRLRAAGLDRPPPVRASRRGWATLPLALLKERCLSGQPKVLYAAIQFLPGFCYPSVDTTWEALRSLTGLSDNTVRSALRILEAHDWLAIHRPRRKGGFQLTIRNPHSERARLAIAAAERRLQRAPFLGEALMREYLNLLADSEEYDDDASPGFLVNPYTGEEMQFDRYYPPHVAFEYNGPQHYGPTQLFPDSEAARKQQGRDLIKLGICAARGIRLVVVHGEDLTLEGMRRKIEGLLPLRNLDGLDELIAYLESRSAAYRRSSAAQQA